MALHPDEVLSLGQLKCIGDTANALVAVGVAERVGHGWRCAVAGQALKNVLTWFQLYHVDTKCLMHLGIVKARRPGGQEYYVTCTNHTSLSNTLWVLPMEGFPRVNSIPLHAKRAKEEGWVLTEASDADRAALRAQGFLRGCIEPPRQIADRVQAAATATVERQAKPAPAEIRPDIVALAGRFAQADAGMWAAAHAMAKGEDTDFMPPEPEMKSEPEPATLKVYKPEPEPEKPEVLTKVEVPDFDEALLAKMFANLAAHGMTLQDLAG